MWEVKVRATQPRMRALCLCNSALKQCKTVHSGKRKNESKKGKTWCIRTEAVLEWFFERKLGGKGAL